MNTAPIEKSSASLLDIVKLSGAAIGLVLVGILVLIMFPIFLISATQIVIRFFLTVIKYLRLKVRGQSAA